MVWDFKGEDGNSQGDSKDFPGGPVARTLFSQCRGPGFDSKSGN